MKLLLFILYIIIIILPFIFQCMFMDHVIQICVYTGYYISFFNQICVYFIHA